MPLNHAIRDRSLQALPTPISQKPPSPVSPVVPSHQNESMDPLASKVFGTAKQLLVDHDQIAVKEVIESIGMDVGESAVRDRLNSLVESGHLECLPGSGRRPSYYYLPDGIQPDEDLSDEALLRRLKRDRLAKSQRVAELQEQLDAALADQAIADDNIQALERVIELKSQFREQTQSKQGEG